MGHGDNKKSIRELTIERVKANFVEHYRGKILQGLKNEGINNPTEEDVVGVIDRMYELHGERLEQMYREVDRKLRAQEAKEKLEKQTDELSGSSSGPTHS